MTDEQWRLTWELLESAATLADYSRPAFIRSNCNDPEVLAQALELLSELKSAEPLRHAQPDPQPGDIFGRYELTALLSSGGSGRVYSARDTELDRDVALKFLAQESFGSSPAVARLIREARAASALNHPNIVTIYDVVRSGSRIAIVMELIKGTVLRTHCGQPAELTRIVRWATQIAQALAAAHALGIIHRDIKPENIMVREDNYVKVLDFGLARQYGAGETSTLGLPVGTLRYMSPERLQGVRLTPASDVFSFGVVLYELSTGKHPFAAEHVIETTNAIATRIANRPSAMREGLPPAFDSLVLSMLSKIPDSRPSMDKVVRSLDELLRALDRGMTHNDKPESTVPRSSGRIRTMAVGVLFVILVSAAIMLTRCMH